MLFIASSLCARIDVNQSIDEWSKDEIVSLGGDVLDLWRIAYTIKPTSKDLDKWEQHLELWSKKTKRDLPLTFSKKREYLGSVVELKNGRISEGVINQVELRDWLSLQYKDKINNSVMDGTIDNKVILSNNWIWSLLSKEVKNIVYNRMGENIKSPSEYNRWRLWGLQILEEEKQMGALIREVERWESEGLNEYSMQLYIMKIKALLNLGQFSKAKESLNKLRIYFPHAYPYDIGANVSMAVGSVYEAELYREMNDKIVERQVKK